MLGSLNKYNDNNIFEPQILSRLKFLEKEKFNPVNHDVGAIIYCSFGNIMRISKDIVESKPIIIDAANTLKTRYDSEIGLIRFWDNWKDEWQYVIIIDNMMNLELSVIVTELSGQLHLKIYLLK